MKKRVLLVVGTRPEAVKLAPVAAALAAHGDVLETQIALTGQHTELVDDVLSTFELDVDHDLGIMREGQTLYDVAAGCLAGLGPVVQGFRPDALVVQGDTATVFFGALVGYFEGVLVAHLEAGLRSGDKWAPFPEEMFRRWADAAADLHFAPTRPAADNLRREGIPDVGIHVTGNTVVDALNTIAGRAGPPRDPQLAAALTAPRMALVTAHRRESFGEPMRRALGAVRTLADEREDLSVLLPVHPNPEVRSAVLAVLGGHPRVLLTEPLSYPDMVLAMKHAALILTDSGGVQEEAPTLGTPVLVLRDVTERPEGVTAGFARTVGTDPDVILTAARDLLASPPDLEGQRNPYGDGRAAARVADILMARLTGRARTTTDWGG